MNKITPVLLAGGSGTRLWPLSRKSYPKQFANLIGDTSLFQKSALRLYSSNKIEFNSHITVTHSNYRFIVAEQLQNVGIEPGPILIEPDGKNTAPAILAASLYAFKIDTDAILITAPSDHIIPNMDAFHDVIHKAIELVKTSKIVTFGITPSHAETGYGYLELSEASELGSIALKRFVEKPDALRAQEMVDSGNFLWNSGIFMFRAKDMIGAFKNHSPELFETVLRAFESGAPDLGFFRLNPKAWSKCDNISIDYAIMERVDNLVVIPFSAGWSDLGSWDAVWQEMGPDENGVALSKNAHSIYCKNTLLRSEDSSQEVLGIGLENILVIAMPDAVLVAQKDQVQNVTAALLDLKSKGVSQAETFTKDHRPWGWFETLVICGSFQVKRIFVKPGAAISLQSHRYRSEHWVVVEGNAKVTVDNNINLVSEGQSIYVPLGAVHRMENPGKVPMVIVEVQTGTYLGEDDIIRYEDLYARD